MDAYAWVIDAVVAVLVVLSAYLAMVRGLMRELFALASWIVAFFAAFFFAPMLTPILTGIPGLGSLLEDCQIAVLVSFVVVFGLTLIVLGLIFFVLTGPTRNTTASVLDQGLGFMYGALRGLVLVAIVYIGYVQVAKEATATDAELPRGQYEVVDQAWSVRFVRPVAELIWERRPEEMPAWLETRIDELMGRCESGL